MIRQSNFLPRKRTQSLALLAAALIAVVTGTWLGVRLSTDYLLFEDATSTARSWADHLTRNLSDLEQIAAGESPSTSSMAFFKNSLNGRHVFRYEIYDRHGFTLLVAEDESIRFVDISDYNDRAHNAIRTRSPVVDMNEGTDGFPRLYGRAFYPVFVNDLLFKSLSRLSRDVMYFGILGVFDTGHRVVPPHTGKGEIGQADLLPRTS